MAGESPAPPVRNSIIKPATPRPFMFSSPTHTPLPLRFLMTHRPTRRALAPRSARTRQPLPRLAMAALLAAGPLAPLAGCDEQATRVDRDQQALQSATQRLASRGSGYNVAPKANLLATQSDDKRSYIAARIEPTADDWAALPEARRRELEALRAEYERDRDNPENLLDAKTAAEQALNRLKTQVALEAQDNREINLIYNDLEGVIEGGTPAQKLDAVSFRSRVVADGVQGRIADARDASVTLTTASQRVNDQVGVLWDYDALLRQTLQDRSGAIEKLNEAIAQQQARLKELATQTGALRSRQSELQEVVEAQTQAAQAARSRGQSLNSQAFSAEKMRGYELQLDALEEQKQANAADYKRQVAEAELEVIGQRLAPLQEQVDSVEALLTTLESDRQAMQGLEEAARTAAAPIQGRQAQVIEQLNDTLSELSNQYEQEVADPMAAGYEAAEEAAEQLRNQAPSGTPSPALQRKILNIRMTQLQALATHARAAGGLGQTALYVQNSLQPILPEAAQRAQTVVERMQEQLTTIQTKLTTVNETIDPLFTTVEAAADNTAKASLAILRESANSLTQQVAVAEGWTRGEAAQVAEPRTLVDSAPLPAPPADGSTPPATDALGMPADAADTTDPAAEPAPQPAAIPDDESDAVTPSI